MNQVDQMGPIYSFSNLDSECLPAWEIASDGLPRQDWELEMKEKERKKHHAKDGC